MEERKRVRYSERKTGKKQTQCHMTKENKERKMKEKERKVY